MSDAATNASGVTIERTTAHDIYKGSVPALIAAGIIERRHFEPQPGRRRGLTHFLPDGSPLPAGIPVPASLPGALSLQVNTGDEAEVRLAVSVEERRIREEAESTVRYRRKHSVRYRGSRERLVRDGIQEHWLADLPEPGKKRSRRTLYEGEQRIEVSASERGFTVDITHIDYYNDKGVWGRASYLRRRAEYGLPLIVKKHLTLVWSAP